MTYEPITRPPGFAGELANFIYQNSFIQIPEIAVCATMALLAGATGRGYRTPTNKDLSQYMILVADTGIGKDAIHEGIPRAIEAAGHVADSERLVRREDFVSGAALHAAILKSPGFLNLQGEFGRKLKRMANGTDSPMQELRTKMTRLYSTAYMEGKAHSRPEDCLPGVSYPAYSFLGETTPRTFLDLLTPDMLEDGFLSRFLIISYDGERPRANHAPPVAMAEDMRAIWAGLLMQCVRYCNPSFTVPTTVAYANEETRELFDEYEEECRLGVNDTNELLERAIWARAHLKALKVASQLAVADHYTHPRIQTHHAEWAIDLVRRDVALFEVRQRSGDIGNDDHARIQKVVTILRDYASKGAPVGYGVSPAMHQSGIITYGYLQKRTSSLPLFKNHPARATEALRLTLRTLVDSGSLVEVQRDTLLKQHNQHGKAYYVVSLPT